MDGGKASKIKKVAKWGRPQKLGFDTFMYALHGLRSNLDQELIKNVDTFV
jgi:hypothetical protein